MLPGQLRVVRGGITESLHGVDVVVMDADGHRLAGAGDERLQTVYRSVAKPFQALPLVEDGAADAFGLTDEELAICCASHNSEPRHLELAISILNRVGLHEDALECGPHLPFAATEAAVLLRAGEKPRPLHNNCSGKHAGMLALAVHHGWPTEGYTRRDHPVQRRMLGEIARWACVPEREVGVATDGCGVPTFAAPLDVLAASFARFAEAAGRETGAGRIVHAMTANPFSVGGTGRLCTELMAVSEGRIFVKTGAEGVYCAGAPSAGIGIALKIRDGSKRASDPALLRVLEVLGLLSSEELMKLDSFRRPEIRNTLGEVVGEIVAEFALDFG